MTSARRISPALIFSAITLAVSALCSFSSTAHAQRWSDVIEQQISLLETHLGRLEAVGSSSAASGGQQTGEHRPARAEIGAGAVLKLGSTGARASLLAAKLEAQGYLKPGYRSDEVDGVVEAALKAFQSANGITPDGKAGEETVAILDQDTTKTAQAIRATLPRMRALLADLPEDVAIVNLPSQNLVLLRAGTVALTMDTAVGRPSRPTPLLTDEMTHIIVNPTWTVPQGIMKADKLPNLRRKASPGISNASVWLDGDLVNPANVNWNQVSPGRIRIVQSPGDHNALGRLKFNLTNGENIYMHDTNEPKVFAKSNRAVSSGCVRLSKPRDLAQEILSHQGISPERISAMIESGKTQWIKLDTPLPIRFIYWTAMVDTQGHLRIYRDIYDMDAVNS